MSDIYLLGSKIKDKKHDLEKQESILRHAQKDYEEAKRRIDSLKNEIHHLEKDLKEANKKEKELKR